MAQTTNRNRNRNRALVAGAAALLLGGLSVGGALVTTNSTIFDNVFQSDAASPDAAELIVDGPAMSASYTGAINGEMASEYYTLENTSSTKSLKFNLTSRIQPGGNKADELAAELSTRIAVAGVTASTGKLDKMAIAAGDQITIPAGGKIVLRLDVFVADKDAFTSANLGDDAEVKVDYLFDSIFLP